jgi:hypothetical protein
VSCSVRTVPSAPRCWERIVNLSSGVVSFLTWASVLARKASSGDVTLSTSFLERRECARDSWLVACVCREEAVCR